MIEARDVVFNYSTGTPILDGWSARFDRGEVVAITGPSGRGKSTLLYLLGLMLKPGSGALYLDGVNVAEFPDAARSRLRAEYFGFVFQDAALDATRTILDNVVEAALYRGQSRTEAKNRARALMSRFGVDLGESIKPAQISGGQAQRLSLCRALLNDPRYLLADEPTGNLDAKSADIVVAGLREQADAGSVVIVVTHDPSLVDRCDREIVL